jgi:hypothetical protein
VSREKRAKARMRVLDHDLTFSMMGESNLCRLFYIVQLILRWEFISYTFIASTLELLDEHVIILRVHRVRLLLIYKVTLRVHLVYLIFYMQTSRSTFNASSHDG